ncbi:hypothetical protein [Granulicoccus phenolivorans]|uniref:hypothetical protein n=1 Tax=Granulicoccus phenolivorans TaxID=266854 RepID=UPI000404E7F2|nr:hypothetical protein [Granulicoccus phenolivorans]
MSAVLTSRPIVRTDVAVVGSCTGRDRRSRELRPVRDARVTRELRATRASADPVRRSSAPRVATAAAGCRVQRPVRPVAVAAEAAGPSELSLKLILGTFALLVIVGVFCVVSTALQVTADPGEQGAPALGAGTAPVAGVIAGAGTMAG